MLLVANPLIVYFVYGCNWTVFALCLAKVFGQSNVATGYNLGGLTFCLIWLGFNVIKELIANVYCFFTGSKHIDGEAEARARAIARPSAQPTSDGGNGLGPTNPKSDDDADAKSDSSNDSD